MSNPLFDALMNANQNRGGFGNMGMQNQFQNFVNQFKQNSNITPQQRVQQLLDSGQMSQEQFNNLRQMANQLTGKKY